MNSKLLLKASKAILRAKRISEANKKRDQYKELVKKNEVKNSGTVTAINSNRQLNDKAMAYIKNSSLYIANPKLNTGSLSSSINISKAFFSLKNELEANKPIKRLKISIGDNY